MAPTLLLLLTIVPYEDVLTDRADVLYLEHFYDENGKKVFEQLCPLVWHPHKERWEHVTYRIEYPTRQGHLTGHLRPEKDWRTGEYIARFVDRQTGTLRVIRAPLFREDWVQEDSEELAHNTTCPRETRRGLLPAKRVEP